MRVSGLMVLALVVGACGEPGPVAADGAAEPGRSVMEAEAEKVCAEMTSFRADTLAGKPPEIQSKLRREYDLCVKTVAREEVISAEAPALRGRTTAP